jgi:hypothetical protein
MIKKKSYYHPPFSIEITNFLIQEYEKKQYPSIEMIQMFANKLNLTFKQVRRWFETRRSRLGHSKQHKLLLF